MFRGFFLDPCADCNGRTLLQVIGQSNACGRAALPVLNPPTNLVYEGQLLTDQTETSDIPGLYGVEMFVANCLEDVGCENVLVKTCRGGITAPQFLSDYMDDHLAKVSAERMAEECSSLDRNVIIWVQGERDARIQSTTYQADEAAVFDRLLENCPDAQILSVLLNPLQNMPANGITLVNNAKWANSAIYPQVQVIGGTYQLLPDDLHYDEVGLVQMAADICDAI